MPHTSVGRGAPPRASPSQVLSTRKRKDASVDNITVQVCLFAFDLLYLNGEPLLRKPLAERRDALKASLCCSYSPPALHRKH